MEHQHQRPEPGLPPLQIRDNVSTLIWDNPFRATPSTDPNAYTAPGAFDGSAFNPTNASSLPVRTAGRKTDATALNADLGTRFGQSLDLTFRYRYYDLDNKAPRISFPGYVRYDAVWEAIGRITVPYS